jgi:hypothetical protein
MGYYFLVNCPTWVVFTFLYTILIGALLPIRKWKEGLPYNNSFASEYGDIALILVVQIGAEVLKRGSANDCLRTTELYYGMFAVCVGILWQLVAPSRNLGDTFHNVVGVPTIIYFLSITVLHALWPATLTEKVAMITFGVAWLLLVIYDAKSGRLDQQKWLKDHYRP